MADKIIFFVVIPLIFTISFAQYTDPIFLQDVPETGNIEVKHGFLFYWFFMPRDNCMSAPIITLMAL